jgi:hypothetical protein
MDRMGPQGLKPRTYGGSDGTAEAVPFPETRFSTAGSIRARSGNPSPRNHWSPLIIRALYLSLHV